MQILAGEHYSDALALIGYEALSLTSDVALDCKLVVSHDGFMWQAFDNVTYHLAVRTAWSVPSAVMEYQYLKLQVTATDTYRSITTSLTNLEQGGIPAATGNNQFVYASLAGAGLVPAPVGAGYEFPCIRAGTPAVHRNHYAAANPAVGDDINDGFNIMSLWHNTATGDLFICTDASAGAAVWHKIVMYLADSTLRLGGSANYVNIAADGTLTLVGTAKTYDDEVVDAYNLKTTGPGVSLEPIEGVIEFVHTAQVTDYCSSNTQFRHNRALLEHVNPHIHFFQAEAVVPNFMMYYRWQINGGAKATAWTPYKCNTPVHTYIEGTLHQIVEGEGITPPEGTTLSDILQLRICRDHDNVSTLFAGQDPYSATVGVMSIDIHRVIDSLGSAQEYVK
jgi:hypothetical protein